MKWASSLLFVVLISMISMPDEPSEKITAGAVEEIVLLPWGVRLHARIDTGAATSSPDVCDVEVEVKHVSFSLSDRCGGHKVQAHPSRLKRGAHIQRKHSAFGRNTFDVTGLGYLSVDVVIDRESS